ncbi:MAG: hypothetical protein JNL08_07595 [Planctomycetes bacterium]|nr:hypothetical protein [Planctomycetota bacterium]
MNAPRHRAASLLALAALCASLAAQGTPIGFEETYALAPDRAAAVATLIPGTDDWYYYHCRERLDARDFATVRQVLPAWIQRHGRTQRTIEIENREALLSFGDDPERTWTFLRDRLGLRFDHQRVVPGERAELPSRLDPALLSHAVLTERALQQHPSDTDGFTARALPALAQTELDGDRLRSLLTRLQRPDVDNLPALIVRDLDHRQSGGFGSLPIHGELRLAQLEECVRLRPRLLQDPRFVDAWLQRMEPTQDVDWRRDPTARAAELQRLWQFAQRLSPAFNSLKAHVLYHWLQHDLSSGAPDRDRFLAYVRLPRRGGPVAEQHLRRHQNAPEFVTPQQEFPTGLPPIGDDEALLRRCLQHFFAAEDGYESYAEFLPADWLQRLFAETKLLLGQGDPERWYSLLADPAEVARLDQRVELEFAATSRTEYGGNEPVTLELDVKNVPVLLLKVFAIDAFRYHAEKQREVDASIELDGVVANHEQTFRYDAAPMRRMRRTFALPMLAEPGTYVVEFVGNGISSRAVIHKGHLRCAVRPAAGGHVFRIHDETGTPRRQASIWFGGRDYAPDAAGDILLPFTTDPGQHAVVLHEGTQSALQTFDHLAENYALHGGVHVEREALVAGRTTRLLVRPQLRLGAHPVSVQLLQQPVLTLIATDLDGIATKQEVRDLQLIDGQELVHEFTVPERLKALQVQLSATVRDLAGKDVPLATTAVTFACNGIDRGATTTSVQLLRTPQGHVLEARGKNGEVKAGFPCRLQLAHRDYAEPIEVTLQTDADGRIELGTLPGIDTVQVHGTGFACSFSLATRSCRLPTVLHGLAGETLRLPYQGTAPQPTRAEFSLLGWERDEFARLALADGFVELRGLEPGDYQLTLHETGTQIPVRITRGGRDGGWLIGRERVLEAGSASPLQLRSLALDATGLLIRVANPTAATRVHVATTRFLPAFPLFDDLGGAPSRPPVALDTAPIESSFHAGRQLGDEYRYVLERRFATKYAGNMLPRPSLLLNPWQLDEQSWNSAVGLGGGAGGKYGGRGRRRAGGHPGPAPGAPPVDVGAAGEFANLDWLPRTAPLLANLRPDADGVVRVPAAELGDGQIVHVLAVDGDQAVHDTALRAEAPLQPRPRQLREALDATRHFVEQKRIEFVAAGETAVLPDARSAQVEVYDSLASVHGLLATLCSDPALSRFAFVLQWPLLDSAQKRARYAENACHELHFFLWQKDRAFFDAVVRPLLVDKLAKTFLDHWLLGDDLQRYVEPWAFAQLNLIERILLAQRLDEQGRAAIARSVRELLELRPVPPSTLDALFDLALKAQQLGTEGDAQLLLMQKVVDRGPGDTMPPQPTAAAPAPAERQAFDDRSEEMGKDKKADADEPARKPEAEANEVAEEIQALGDELKQRGAAKQLWRAVEATRLRIESDYWRRTPLQTTPDVVAPNRFWRDYATAPAGRPFASTAVVEAHGSFLEAMFALAVLDLPFAAGRHEVTADGDRRTLRAATPLLLVRKEVTATEAAADVPPLLVGQNLFRLDERYRYENGEQRDAFVTDEFLVDTGYGCQVVVTNPTSQRRTVALLLQIPAGALPLNSGFWTKSRTLELQPYATATVEYAFYFPTAGDFAHYAVQAAEAGALAAAATARTLHVVASPSRVDTGSWEHVSQLGSAAEVLAHIDGANVQRLDLGRIAWRLRDRGFFGELLPRLRARHAFDATVWSYGVLHRDEAAAREFLQHRDDLVAQCGAVLQSPLLTFDVVERKRYQQLELDPLVHARAHRLGSRRGIGNEHLAAQHRAAMDRIGYHAQLDADDWITVTYLLLLQDRVEEALQAYAKIDAARVTTHLQYDYLTAYAAFFTGDLDRARRTAERHRDHPVAHWQQRFIEVLAQLDEAQGRPSPGRGDQVPTDLAAAAPSLELALEGRRATVAWRNLPQCEVRFYELDVEFAFSARPFASDDGTSAAYVQPILTRTLDLPADQRELTFDLPDRFAQKNVLVEVRGAGLVRSQTWFANALQVRFLESWGQVAVSEPGTGTPLPKAYVKVFAKLPSGQVRFHKDGYTDLRGRFDYASLSDDPNAGAVRYAVLVLDDQRGAVIRELAPPTR